LVNQRYIDRLEKINFEDDKAKATLRIFLELIKKSDTPSRGVTMNLVKDYINVGVVFKNLGILGKGFEIL
jgi:hypothetical protein